MFNLEEARTPIESLIKAIVDSLKIEVSIFDVNGKIFYCTPTYLKKKGSMVHTEFIKAVLNKGNIIVNSPGNTPLCKGCRFSAHCPSTIEILCCITVNTEIIGVADFTSFTKEGQKRISENVSIYLNTIANMADAIGRYVISYKKNINNLQIEYIMKTILQMAKEPIIFIDCNGIIMYYNEFAEKIFKINNSCLMSIYSILSLDMVNKIFSGTDILNEKINIKYGTFKLTTKNIIDNNIRLGTVLDFFICNDIEQIDNEYKDNMLGHSPSILKIKNLIKKIADSPTPVLIIGETGTGKELIAKALHEESIRKSFPFIPINCSSIPETLFESELFGYSNGAFTGARKEGKIGKIEMAQNGTLFLDELGELPLLMQPKLLRVLQDHNLERIGSTKKIPLNIRIIAATNCNIDTMIKEGKFRKDLFYRIGVIIIKTPPLRERKEDIMEIALNYIKKLKKRMYTPLNSISPEVKNIFLQYDWPGNIRELENVVEYAANICDTDIMTVSDLPENIQKINKDNAKTEMTNEMTNIKHLLSLYGYTTEGKKKVAKEMGISLRTLYRKLHILNNT